MFQRILVPLDGSSRAERALPVAARLAQASAGTLVVLRAVSLTAECLPYAWPDLRTLQIIIDADIAEARDYLESITHRSCLSDVHTETAVLLGPAADTILAAVQTSHPDLIVLCSHGYTGFKRWVLGSVAEKVVHHAPVPVLLLREGGPTLVGTPARAEGPLRALIPLDGSARAKAAIVPAAQLIAALAAPGPGALHFTRVVVVPGASRLSQSERAARMHVAKRYLSTTVEHIRLGLVAPPVAALKLAMTWSVTLEEDVASGILRVAEGGEETGGGVCDGANLIAMATHGYGAWQRWAMGSVTERVLHACRLPLLIVRPPDMLEEGQKIQTQVPVAEQET